MEEEFLIWMKFRLRDGKIFRRHVMAIEKNCEKGDLGCRKRQRQAILQWAYDPYTRDKF